MVRLIILRLLESYFRHAWLYLIPIVVMTIIGIGFVMTRESMYMAAGTIYVQTDTLLAALTDGGDGGGNWWTKASETTTSEINELMRTDAFVRSAIKQTKLEAHMNEGPTVVKEIIDEFRNSVSIQPLGDNLVMFSATSKDPKLAQQIAKAVLETFIQWKLNANRQNSAQALEFFERLHKPYEQEVKRAEERLNQFLKQYPEPVRGERPEDEARMLRQLSLEFDQAQERLYDTLQKQDDAKLAQIRADSQIRQNYALIDSPSVPTQPLSSLKGKIMTILPFVVVGFILSMIGIIGWAVLDRSMLFPIDVRHSLELPLLATLPNSPITTMYRQQNAMTSQASLGTRKPQTHATSGVRDSLRHHPEPESQAEEPVVLDLSKPEKPKPERKIRNA